MSRGALLVAGTPVVTSRMDTLISSDTLIGVVLTDTSATVIPVPNPLPGRMAVDPRVAPAREGGWHVVFVDSTNHGPPSIHGPMDSAAVWYGRFDGARWHDVARIGLFHHASLDIAFGPDLGVDGDQLRFAFAFDKLYATVSNARGNQGIVMLRRDQGRWSADTLHTQMGPSYVRLAKAARVGAWHVGLVQSYYEAGSGSHSSSMFVTDYDSAWHVPRLVASGDAAPISRPTLISLSDGLVAAWARRRGGLVEWTRLPNPGAPQDSSTINALFADTQGYGAVALDATTLLWHTGARPSRDSVRTVLYRNGQASDGGMLIVNNDSFLQLAVPVSPGEIVLFTSRIHRSPVEPPATTMVSRLNVRCSQGL